MPLVSTQIEIAAPPAKVREAFLDFETYPAWATSFIKSVTITESPAPSPADLKVGDALHVEVTGMKFDPKVTANTAEEFKWMGSMPLVLSGEHAFKFQPSTKMDGHTTFVQEENFQGLASFMFGETWGQGQKAKAGFEGFNRDLKARAESLQ